MAPKRAASKGTQKAQKEVPRLQDAQSQSSTPRHSITDNVSLEDCIRSREAAEATTQQPDQEMPQAGPSRAVDKGKVALTQAELKAQADADYTHGLNSRIARFGQNSLQVSAYRWSYRHRQPESDYASSADSERGRENTDADAELAALLQAEETEGLQKATDQVYSDREAAEHLQSQLHDSVSQQLKADRRYAEALERGPKTRAATRQAAAAQSSSVRTKGTQSARLQALDDNETLRAKISELQANLDHAKSTKRTAKVIEPQFSSLANANALAAEHYDDFDGELQQAGIPPVHPSRKVPSTTAGPSRIARLATNHEPASAALQAQTNTKQNFMDMRNVNRPPARQSPTGAPSIALLKRMHIAHNRTAAAQAPTPQVAVSAPQAAGAPQAHRSSAAVHHAAYIPAPPNVPAIPQAPAFNAAATHAAQAQIHAANAPAPQAAAQAPATAAAYNPFAPAPIAAAVSAQPTAAAGYQDRDPDPDLYFNKSFQQLTAAEKKQVKRNLNDSIYMTFDEFSKDQDCTPEAWLSHLDAGLRNNSVNPDHAVRFLRGQHLGDKAARSLASWFTNNPDANFDDFKTAFSERNPGKPPQVTRASWKTITMKSCGTYHAYLQEFNRQKALINTGPDEVVEQFLAGLSPQLKSQVEFLKNRNWQADEFDELVKAATERVNSSVSSSATASEHRPSPQSARPHNKRSHTQMTAGLSNRNPSHGLQPQPIAEHNDTAATTAFCENRRLCTTCKRLGHNSASCRYEYRPFRFPRDWDQVYWQERARLAAAAAPPPPVPRPRFNKSNRHSKK